MPFPPSERVVFEHNPLAQVITQVKFPAVLSIVAAEPAAFQERVRNDYPLYTREDALEMPPELTQLIARMGRPPAAVRHTFRTLDENRAIFLTQEFLAVEEKHYLRWEAF